MPFKHATDVRFGKFQRGKIGLFKSLLLLACLSVVPWAAQAGGMIHGAAVPEQKLALGVWTTTYQGHLGAIIDYSFSQNWGVAWVRRFGERYNYAQPAHPAATSNYSTSQESGGFTALELRRRFYHSNTEVIGNGIELYGALGVLQFHGFKMKETLSADQLFLNQKLYEDSNYTMEVEQAPFRTATVGFGVNGFLYSSWFGSFGMLLPVQGQPPSYRYSSTDPQVDLEDVKQEVNSHRSDYPNPLGVGASINLVAGYAF